MSPEERRDKERQLVRAILGMWEDEARYGRATPGWEDVCRRLSRELRNA